MKRKLFCLVLTIVLATSFSQSLVAAKTITNDVYVEYENGLSQNDVPGYLVHEIIASNPNAHNITIYEIGEAKQMVTDAPMALEMKTNLIAPMSFFPVVYYYTKTEKYIRSQNVLNKDVFQFSCAKGQTVTLTQSYNVTVKGSFAGEVFDSTKLGIDVSLTGGYSKSTSYTGPSDSSPYNSRQFRTKFYENVEAYIQYADGYSIRDKGEPVFIGTSTKSGNLYIPTYYVNYSVDSYVSQ